MPSCAKPGFAPGGARATSTGSSSAARSPRRATETRLASGSPCGGIGCHLELLGHLRSHELEGRGGTDHHLELADQAVLVELQHVDSLDLLSIHHGGELEHRHPVVRVLELVHV